MNSVPAIHIRGRYVLDGRPLFSLPQTTLDAGRWTCLLGSSGSGKSTLLRLILGLPTAGRFVGAIEADDARPLSCRMSYMAQSDLLLPWLNLRENVVLGARLRGEVPDMARADSLLDRVGLGGYRRQRPASLSGGMRQRAALARTLMEDRAVVLLDEPFSALDAGTRADMQELAAEVLKGRTVLLVTHDPAEASRLGHAIVLLSGGGLRTWPAPAAAPIRPVDDPGVLVAQASLLAELRGPRP